MKRIVLALSIFTIAGCTGVFQSAPGTAEVASLADTNQLASRITRSGTTFDFTSAEKSVAQGACSSVASIALKDGYGQPILFNGSASVPLVASPAVLNFYSDASCSSAVSAMTLNGSSSTGQFYFKASATGSVSISASLLGLITASQNETITAATSPSPSPQPAPAPSPSPAPTGSCTGPANAPDGSDGMGGCFPGVDNTGPNAPASTMATYTGPCTITTPNTVIDSKVVNCRVLVVNASGLVIKNSYVNGSVGQDGGTASFTIQDSIIDSGIEYPACSDGSCPAGKYACGDTSNQTGDCGVTGSTFTILRTEIVNSNRAAFCQAPGPCLIQDSYFHGTNLWPDKSNLAHASSVREEQSLTLRHNSLSCSYTGPFKNGDIGCSADLTGYPDFAPIHNNTVDSNLFVANPEGTGFCAYGGGTANKPFSNDPKNATYQVFKNNVWQRGSNNKCGTYGPVTDFHPGGTGNVWTNNKWADGAIINPQ